MRKKIKGVRVAGIVDSKGRCPECNTTLIVKGTNYRFIKNKGIAEFDEEEKYIKCNRCSNFIMLPKIAA